MHQLRAVQNLTKSVLFSHEYMAVLHLHRVPMITMDLLDVIVPHMANLKVLGIYNCPTIHVGHLKPLLDLLQMVRPSSANRPKLDFFPR